VTWYFLWISQQSYFTLDAIKNEQKFLKLKDATYFFGAEMFESGNQLVINEYLKDCIPMIKWLWDNAAVEQLSNWL
jgi:hypothetical protein